jgi:transposase
VHVKSLDVHRTRALLGARAQLVSMTTRLSNRIRGVLKTFGMLPGAMRGLPFDRRVEALLAERDDLAAIVRPMLTAWRQLREQVAVFDKAVRALAKKDPTCRLLMSVPLCANDDETPTPYEFRLGHRRTTSWLCPT